MGWPWQGCRHRKILGSLILAQAGFHNAALVHAESSLNAEPVRPLFSRQDATGKAMPG